MARLESHDRQIAFHEAGHVVVNAAVGLAPTIYATINPEPDDAGRVRAGHVRLSPKNYECGRLFEWSAFSLHQIRKAPLPKIVDGKPLGSESAVLLYARSVMLMAGAEAEKIFCNGSQGLDQSDLLKAQIFACDVTSSPLEFLHYSAIDAARILREQRHRVEALAAALVEHRTLDAFGIDDIFAGRDVVRRRWGNVVQSAALFGKIHGGLEARRL